MYLNITSFIPKSLLPFLPFLVLPKELFTVMLVFAINTIWDYLNLFVFYFAKFVIYAGMLQLKNFLKHNVADLQGSKCFITVGIF